ncbi:MSCRAMM family protein [Marinicella gelatinilytica]|uniref:MSCRAMM family protein n=1 Tax=Marinicella gelatinilytica TaxID=2996017 RepID=UPI002260813C|nr:carboxypeptidase-like regulatory domain-containing protein [Marinicella gelatinilytica]MCX7545845.1 carboxypeptidase-like regulatory domain-containing protein [Marinicella gelatinilytica]
MKQTTYLLSFIFISLFLSSAVHAKTEYKVNYNYFGESLTDQKSLTQLKQDTQGDGVIKGRLVDRDSGNLLSEDIKFYVVLYKQHPRFGSWDAVDSVDSGQGQDYEFTGLEVGEYAVVIGWKYPDFENPNYETAFLTTIWTPTGGESCDHCEPLKQQAISLTESNPQTQADFMLDKAAVLEVDLYTPDSEELTGYPYIYSLDELGIKRPKRFTVTKVNFDPFGTTTYTNKAVFLLPEGDYRIYAEQAQYHGFIYGESESCRHCEFKVRSGAGQTLSLSKDQPKLAEITFKRISGGFKGLIKDIERSFIQIMDFNKSGNPYDYYTKSNDNPDSDYPLELNVTNLASGYYMLQFSNYPNIYSDPLNDPNYYAYSSLYGGDYCDHPHCDFDNVTPILVRKHQTTQLRPHDNKPTGGMLIGRTYDPHTPDGYLISDVISDNPNASPSFYTSNWLSIYNENKELITTNITSGPFQYNLPAGHYYLKTGHGKFGFTNRYYASTLYPNVDCAGRYCDFSQGTLVEVKDDEDTIIDDIALKRGQGIKGQVTDKQTGQGLSGIRVEVLDSDQHLVSSALTSVDGYYSHWGLLPGKYYLRTQNGSKYLNKRYNINKAYTGGYINQLYPDTTCLNNQCDFSQGTAITITHEDIDHIDFNLVAGEQLSGTVLDINSGAPLYKKRIKVYQTDGTQVGNHLTDQLGAFTTSALLPGDYKILVDGGYLYLDKAVGNDDKDCLFEVCELSDAQTITLPSEPLDIQLTHKKDVLPHYTGMWFNPEESGHGLQFEVLDHDNAAILYVTWFAHVDGEPMWLTGSGPLLGDRAFVDLIITDGQDFPASMNAKIWGELRVKFDDLNHASMSWQPLLEGFESGELEFERLTIATIPEQGEAFYTENTNLDACVTGSYYDPKRSGEGIQITALGNPSNHLSFNWYTYLGDKQFWFTGQGDFNQDTVDSLAYYTTGVNFTPDFDPNQVELIDWGNVTIRKIPQDNLEVTFTPNAAHSDFEQRTVQLIRNSSPFPVECGFH